MTTKKCSKCKKNKPISEFYKSIKKSRGIIIESQCKKCMRKYKQSPKGRYSNYKYRARVRLYEFNLTFEQFMTFWQKPCYYCGDNVKTIGLDRLDNNKGYAMKNVVPCCFPCNRFKSKMTLNNFMRMCDILVNSKDVKLLIKNGSLAMSNFLKKKRERAFSVISNSKQRKSFSVTE